MALSRTPAPPEASTRLYMERERERERHGHDVPEGLPGDLEFCLLVLLFSVIYLPGDPRVRSISEISSCFFGPRPWHIEIRYRVKKTSTINLFGFETQIENSTIEIMETDRTDACSMYCNRTRRRTGGGLVIELCPSPGPPPLLPLLAYWSSIISYNPA